MLALFKKKQPELQKGIEINVIAEQLRMFKNGNYVLKQELEFTDSQGNVIGFGKINRKYINPKT